MKKRILQFGMMAKAMMIALLLGVAGEAYASFYDFSAVCETGQTLYYNIIDAENHYVELTCPGHLTDEHDPWDHHTQPSGDVVLPETVQNDNVIYTVTRIGSQAFYCCNSMTSVAIPNSVTLIGSEAFWSCSGLTGNLTIPNSVTRINSYAFYYCSGLNGSLILSNSLNYIGFYAFSGCNHLNGSLFIPSSVTTIDGCAFSGCSGFTEIQYNATNCSDCNSNYPPFNGCGGTLIIGNNVERIPANMFRGCNFVGSLTIPNSVTSIGDGAFAGRSGFTGQLIIPNSVTIIGGAAFYGCSGFTGSLTIPNSVTAIGQSAFNGCSGFTGSLSIPNSVTTIGSYAFQNCSGFNSNLIIGNSVTTIGYYAFWGCRAFMSIISLSEMAPTLENNAFYNWLSDTPVYVPCGYEGAYSSISWGGFNYFYGMCSGTVSVFADPDEGGIVSGGGTFEGGMQCAVTAMANEGYTFEHWKLNDVVVSNDIEYDFIVGGDMTLIAHFVSDGNIVFADAKVKSICIAHWDTNGDGELSYEEAAIVTSLGNYFQDNTQITSFEELQYFIGLSSIENYAFSGCYNLSGNLILPNSVTSIGNNAFYGRGGLTGNLIIPNSVTTIGNNAFYNCSGFTGDLVIPNSVTNIGQFAFYNCSGFTGNLTIGNSVTTIGYYAFQNCTGLSEMTVLRVTPPSLGSSAIPYANNCPIYVPYESLNNYKTATNWSSYQNRIFPMAYTTISGYGEGEGNYRFIASPLVENTAPTAVDNMITETSYDLYRFDQSEDDEWRNYKANTEDFFLQNGQGYLYANAEDVNLVFKGEFNEDDTKEVGLAYDATATFAGWNLVGNPFPVNAYANKSYYTMNEEGSAIEPNMVSSATAIPACTGVMVMAEAEGETVVFSTEAPEAATNQGCLQIELSQAVELVETPTRKQDGPSTGSVTALDKAIVSFNAGDRLEKFVFNKENAVISIPQGGKELAIACSDKQGEMPLNFKATKNGEYTLTIHPEAVELDYLHLIDNLSGTDVDLLALRQAQGPANYTFEAKTTDYASRFSLVFNGKEADGPSTGSETFAFISNGNLIINGEGTLQVFDVLGHQLVTKQLSTLNSQLSAPLAPGVYVLRLINGDDVKVQKIVVE